MAYRGIQGNILCKFIVIADTHLKLTQEAGDRALWSTHQLAALRVRYVVQQIKRLAPDFVIHLGDMIHPVPVMPDYGPTAEQFKRMFAELDCPLYTLPGNHDIGDKLRLAMPAPVVSQESIDAYSRYFGAPYRAFDAGGCRFVLLNNPILNSGLPREREQQLWLEKELADHADQRIFLAMHYPLYLRDPDEEEHYDNIDRPGRSWLLALIEQYNIEALFSGHAHNFFYNRYGQTDLYTLPSITFVRQDYSELFRVDPAADYGRNDTAKFGFFFVTIYDQGHVARFIRTAGKTLPETNQTTAEGETSPLPSAGQLEKPLLAPIGVDLRHPWAEITEIPYNYILDEFVRRKVRNDAPLLALWDLGIYKARLPIGDLVDPRLRARMATLRAKGHGFRVFSLGVPQGAALEALWQYHPLAHTLEVILPWETVAEAIEPLQMIKTRTRLPIHLSNLTTSRDFEDSVDDYYVWHGFRADEEEFIKAFTAREGAMTAVDGFAFRVGAEADPWRDILAIAKLAGQHNFTASITVQLASDSEAGVMNDESLQANRVAVAVAAALAASGPEIYLDTFCDLDRGYYIRHGLVDRRYNLRLAGRVLHHFVAALPTGAAALASGQVEMGPNTSLYWWQTKGQIMALCLTKPGTAPTEPLRLPGWRPSATAGVGVCHHLATGTSSPLSWRREHIDDSLSVQLELVKPVFSPMFIVIGQECQSFRGKSDGL